MLERIEIQENYTGCTYLAFQPTSGYMNDLTVIHVLLQFDKGYLKNI
jgi:hypothetical protein